MKTATRGNAGEAAILRALVEKGWEVLLPFGGGQPYDLAVHLTGSLFARVQCKTAWEERGCLLFNSLSTDHGHGAQPYVGRADVFGVYLPSRNAVYLVPIDGVAPSHGRLRLEPALNNQRKRIRMAEDFEIETWTIEELADVVHSVGAASAALAA
jgi:hypothetical protein